MSIIFSKKETKMIIIREKRDIMQITDNSELIRVIHSNKVMTICKTKAGCIVDLEQEVKGHYEDITERVFDSLSRLQIIKLALCMLDEK